MIATICYVIAFICFLVAAFGAPVGRLNLVATGLALWILADKLLGAVGAG